jgi:dienelactone hydrolase
MASIALLLCWPLLASGQTRPRPERVVIPEPNGVQLQADLLLPAVVGAPVVIALHGCSGPFAKRDRDWAGRLLAAGHPVLLPNSFASRGLRGDCRARHHVASAYRARRGDAWAAAAWASHQSFARPGGALLLGWSDGGSTVLASVENPPPGLIRAALAFYPACTKLLTDGGWHADVPLLILMGDADDWTPAAPCRALAAGQTNVRIMTFADAYHDFDVPDDPVHVVAGLPFTRAGDGQAHAGTNDLARRAAIIDASNYFEKESK